MTIKDRLFTYKPHEYRKLHVLLEKKEDNKWKSSHIFVRKRRRFWLKEPLYPDNQESPPTGLLGVLLNIRMPPPIGYEKIGGDEPDALADMTEQYLNQFGNLYGVNAVPLKDVIQYPWNVQFKGTVDTVTPEERSVYEKTGIIPEQENTEPGESQTLSKQIDRPPIIDLFGERWLDKTLPALRSYDSENHRLILTVSLEKEI